MKLFIHYIWVNSCWGIMHNKKNSIGETDVLIENSQYKRTLYQNKKPNQDGLQVHVHVHNILGDNKFCDIFSDTWT